ncbi:MAG TPA: CheY-P-specific phosphatase CheC [Firmicutes bacterium]|jgi:chemotaxis protein CheC|nr:CheY-P-specific phosphatase CheC [Bacillota bacterium]
MFIMKDLGQSHFDVLKEIGNIGAGNAATALSQLISQKIEMTVPNVSIMPFGSVSDILGGAEREVAGVYLRVFGDAPSKIVFLFSVQEAYSLVDMILHCPAGTTQEFGDFEQSALKEIGNIMTGAYLHALTKLTGLHQLSSVPSFACDMVGAIMNTALTDLGMIGDYALLIETQFSLVEREINGHFFLVPDPGSLEIILGALGVGSSCQK